MLALVTQTEFVKAKIFNDNKEMKPMKLVVAIESHGQMTSRSLIQARPLQRNTEDYVNNNTDFENDENGLDAVAPNKKTEGTLEGIKRPDVFAL